MGLRDYLGLRHELPPRRRLVLTILSFALPLAPVVVVSYVPWLWHPLVKVTDPGGVDYFRAGMDVDRGRVRT
jgi:NitT/TauT family transport system permease protein